MLPLRLARASGDGCDVRGNLQGHARCRPSLQRRRYLRPGLVGRAESEWGAVGRRRWAPDRPGRTCLRRWFECADAHCGIVGTPDLIGGVGSEESVADGQGRTQSRHRRSGDAPWRSRHGHEIPHARGNLRHGIGRTHQDASLGVVQWHSLSGFAHSFKESVVGACGFSPCRPVIRPQWRWRPSRPFRAAIFRPASGNAAHTTGLAEASAGTRRYRRRCA